MLLYRYMISIYKLLMNYYILIPWLFEGTMQLHDAGSVIAGQGEGEVPPILLAPHQALMQCPLDVVTINHWVELQLQGVWSKQM